MSLDEMNEIIQNHWSNKFSEDLMKPSPIVEHMKKYDRPIKTPTWLERINLKWHIFKHKIFPWELVRKDRDCDCEH